MSVSKQLPTNCSCYQSPSSHSSGLSPAASCRPPAASQPQLMGFTLFWYQDILLDIDIELQVGKETHRWPIINGSAMVLIILRDNLCLFVHFIKEVWLVKQEWIYFTWMFWRFSSFTAQFWFEYIFAPLIIFTAKIFYFCLKFYDFMILSFFPI